MATDRRAEVVWEGSLMDGSGTILSTTSGALPELPVSWASRTESPGGKTSPEDLIAAAHAACFSMALSHALAQAGNPPERLETSATVTFVPGTGITKSALTVTGRVPGIDEAAFREAAEGAKEGCPVSSALKGNVELSVDARLGS
jgi:osmotically inducible protein OsmC